MRLQVCSAVAVMVGVPLAHAAERHVPSQYATIQAAIDASSDGDEVIIAPGTYQGDGNRDLIYGGLAITVRSADPNDPNVVAATAIDCGMDPNHWDDPNYTEDPNYHHRGFYFHSGEGPNSVVAGLTITNGYVDASSSSDPNRWGGGVFCWDSSPTLTNCTISGNSACEGGGVFCYYYSSPTLTDCTISGNSATGSYGTGGGVHCNYYSSPTLTNCTISGNSGHQGGGVYCYTSNPTLTSCTISGNTVDYDGGGVHCTYDSSPTLVDCTISGNTADDGGGVCCTQDSTPALTNCTISGNSADGDGGGGGGVCFYDSSPTLTNCTISGNSANYYGGGVYCYDSSPTLTNCMFNGNSAQRYGGAVCCRDESTPTLTSCTISGNSAVYGGGVHCSPGSPTLENCTISGNSADYYGGGVYCASGSPTLTNCILWDDSPQEIYMVSGSPAVSYSCIAGGWTGAGNIDADPLFVDADGPDDDPNTWEDNDYHISPNSPCINAGDPNGDYTGQLDIDGEPRASGVVDMGSDEVWAADTCTLTLTVENEDWGSVEVEPNDPNYAPFTYPFGTEVTLTAAPVEGAGLGHWQVFDPNQPGDANYAAEDANNPLTIVMDADQQVAAVFMGVHNITQDTWHATIQAAIGAAGSGDIVEIADGTYTGAGNKDLDFGGKAITVRSASGDQALCIIDCEGSGRGFDFHSGEGPDSVVEGLTVRNGYAARGGGVYCEWSSSPTLTNCTISGNAAAGYYGEGGAVYCYYSSPTLTNCTISGNLAYDDGGGVFCYSSSPTLTNCTISGNSAAGDGGGVYCCYGSPTLTNCTITRSVGDHYGGGVYCDRSYPTLTNCTISGNSTSVAYCGGGGVYCSGGSPTLMNCTISGNSAYYGGGVYCSASNPTLTNCILWNDTPQEIHALSGSPAVTYSDVEGGWTGTGNIDADPLFVDPNGPDGDPNTWEDNDYHLSPNSPCINAGDPNYVVNPNYPTDMDGEPRVNGTVDMGADEFWGDHVVLTLVVRGEDKGDVDLSPTPAFSVDTRHWYLINTAVTLTADWEEGKYWLGWEGDISPGEEHTNPLTITMDEDKEISTSFRCGMGVGPFLPMIFAVLGLALWFRRRA